MWKLKLVQCFAILGIVYADTSTEVFQFPISLKAVKGTNVTFHCSIPLPRDDSKVTFNWWREGEYTYLSTATDHRKLFGSKSKFSGFIHINNVRFQDAGIYHCAVQQYGYTIGNQVGSNLTVWVPPTQVKIRPRESPRGSSLSLVCEASAFYPDIIAFEWYKDGIGISTKTSVMKQRNSDGLYQARSFWEEKQAAASGSVYSCLVSHITLENPLAVTHVITYSNAGSQSSRFLMISVCIGYGLICLLFIVLIWKRHQLKDLHCCTIDLVASQPGIATANPKTVRNYEES
ncbi:hypothetical protein scyTo_0012036 [Scyliorhinus torazame]|uniref:Ig-like domain-containing protein n=1 Tax=Scyliorhinus torazame TaxID=75743 RepID=A0A401P0J2_SCYTO|nr:hypothetical protein [Scyliorhinus torazame]